MTHVSRKNVDRKTESLLEDALGEIFCNLTKKEVKQLLASLLSNVELSMLKKRLMAYILLDEKIANDQISQSLKITRQTTARFRYQLLEIDTENFKILKSKFKKWKTKNQFKAFLITLAKTDISRASFREKVRRMT